MDRAKVQLLEDRLRAGVEIYIGYGITKRKGDSDDSKGDQAIYLIRKLAGRYKNLRFVKLGDTHAKALVLDDCAAIGSFNWMSFGGEDKDHKGRRIVRKELSYLIQDKAKAKADEVFNRVFKRFEKYYKKPKSQN
jgi:hypothetical protein